jgi:regulatory Fis family protein
LLLTIAFDALRMMAIVIERKLDPLPIGKEYVRFRDTKSEENLENILRTISPSPSYRRIKGEPPEDRRSDIQAGFFNFIDKLQKKPVGNWRAFPRAVLADHRPAPHPEWDQKAREFLSREIENTLKSDLPILSGKLENAPLQMRTVVRDKYLKWCPQIIFPATGEVVTAKNLDLEKITDEKMQELEGQFNPEIQLGDKEERENLARKLRAIAKSDAPLYWALMKTEGNKSKAAAALGISRTALYERLDKVLEKLKT